MNKNVSVLRICRSSDNKFALCSPFFSEKNELNTTTLKRNRGIVAEDELQIGLSVQRQEWHHRQEFSTR